MLHHSILAAFLFLALGQNTVMAQGGATKTFLQAQIATYPGAAEQGITGNVDMRFPNPTGGFFFSVDVTGLEADCVFCGVHVHEYVQDLIGVPVLTTMLCRGGGIRDLSALRFIPASFRAFR